MDDQVQAPAPDQSTTPIYDISGSQPSLGDMPHEHVQGAIESGKFSFPKGQEINVRSPDGTFGTVPAEKAPDAFKNGYQYATPSMLSEESDHQKYSTPGQQLLTGLEGFGQGTAGFLSTGAENLLSKAGVPGLTPEEQAGRAKENPWIHGTAEAGGFGVGSLTGTGEAALLSHLGEAAKIGLEGANVTNRLALGAGKMAAEMGAYQASDEASKAINQNPNQTVGSAVANVGLSSILGGILGAGTSTLGIAAKSILEHKFPQQFVDEMSALGADVSRQDLMMKEFADAHQSLRQMGTEVGGTNGVRATAMQNIMPELNEKMVGQAQETLDRINQTAAKLEKSGDQSGMVNQLRNQASRIEETLNSNIDPLTMKAQKQIDPSEIYDTLNSVKKQIGEWSQFNKAMVPLNEVAFRNAAKGLGSGLKEGLEDSDVWGKVGNLQKSLNSAWSDSIPALKDAEGKFMTKIGGDPTVDTTKFNSYYNQNGRATSQTVKQKMMGNFVDSVEKFNKATADAYEKAGLESPHAELAMNNLKESMGEVTPGARAARLWYNKIGPQGLAEGLGGGTGFALGHATGIPGAGFSGAYLGKWVLGPVFGSVIKPLLEKGANTPGFHQALSYGKAVLAGDAALTKATANVFGSGLKTIPSHLYHDNKDLEKLDKNLHTTMADPNKMFNVAGNIGNLMPDHAQAISQTAMNAVNYLNSKRPMNTKNNPLDSDIPISKAQNAPFMRSLSIANQPLLVMDHIKSGTLLPQDVADIKTLYPSYYPKMSQELMSSMTDHISNEGSISYKVKQSVSMFLGQPMDSTMTPNSIQSIQTVFAANKSQPQAQPTAKKDSPAKMGKLSENLQTPGQASTSRLVKA